MGWYLERMHTTHANSLHLKNSCEKEVRKEDKVKEKCKKKVDYWRDTREAPSFGGGLSWRGGDWGSKTELKEVNTGEVENNGRCWGSWPAGSYFICQGGSRIRIILRFSDIRNKWESLLKEEGQWNKAKSGPGDEQDFVPFKWGRRKTERITSPDKSSTFQGRKAGSRLTLPIGLFSDKLEYLWCLYSRSFTFE